MSATGRISCIARSLHWTAAVLIAGTVPVGFYMSNVYAAAQRDSSLLPRLHLLSAVHHTIGFTLLLLACAWLPGFVRRTARRLSGRDESGGRDEMLRNSLARVTHGVLMLLLIALPFSGWAALSAYGEFPTYFLGFHVPPIIPKVSWNDPHGYGYFAGIHQWCWKAGGALLALHVGAALWHQFIRKDGLMSRMTLGGTTNPGSLR